MAKQPESLIVDKIMRSLTSRGAWCFKVHGGPMQQAGVPDIIGVLNGRFIAIEVKVPGERPSKLQELTLSRIRAAGGIAGWATSVEESGEILDGTRS